MGRFRMCLLCIILLLATGCSPQAKPESTPDKPNTGTSNPNTKLYTRGSSVQPKIALTFDDGPEAHWTPMLLDILKQENVKATFFVIGKNVEAYPDILRRIVREGHAVGNHTYSHANLSKLTPAEIEAEIDKCDKAIEKVIGRKPTLVRPPYGFHNNQTDSWLTNKGKVIILWSTDTKDWVGLTANVIEDKVISNARNGMIVLQHAGNNPKLGGSLEAIPDIIHNLRQKGFELVRIPELLNIDNYEPIPGQ